MVRRLCWSGAAAAGSGVYSLPGYASVLAGFVIFGTPPVSGLADMADAFLPNPAVQIGFTADVDRDGAIAYATSFLAPGSTLSVDALVDDILATDGTARSDLSASLASMPVVDEVDAVRGLTTPLAILHGEGEQLVSLEYLRKLDAPTLWRDDIQLIAGAGHAPQEETPDELGLLLEQFMSRL